MGDYNADPNPDLDKMSQVAFGQNFIPLDNVKADQFSTAGTNKVYSFVVKIGSTRLQFLVDPDGIGS